MKQTFFRTIPGAAMSERGFLLLSLMAAVLAAIAFLPGLPGAFVFDDIPNIVNNSSIHLSQMNLGALLEILSTKQVSGAMRGIPTLTFALDYWRAGGVADPATFKSTNILIHAVTTFALAAFQILLQKLRPCSHSFSSKKTVISRRRTKQHSRTYAIGSVFINQIQRVS